MENIKQTWWQLTSIQIGGAICLPVIMVGQILAQNYGLLSALIALLLGNGLLLLLGLITLSMTLRNRVSTVEHARTSFGKYGTKLFALTMIISMVGWFAIQLNIMSLSLYDTIALLKPLPSTSILYIILLLGAITTLTALKGIQALDKLSTLSMPLLIATMGYALYLATFTTHVNNSPQTFSLGGISLVIATAIAAVVDLPTYYRFAKNKRHGFISVLILFIIAIPAIEFVGVYLGTYSPGVTIIDVLTSNGNKLWRLWVGLFLLLAGWTTNNTNLYSATISLQTLMPSLSQPNRTIIVGAISTLLACFNILQQFEVILDGMAILVVNMAAVILTNFIFYSFRPTIVSSKAYLINSTCWILGTLLGLISLTKFISLTGMPVIDGWLITSILVIISKLLYKKS